MPNTQIGPGINKIIIGLGWHVQRTSGVDFDLDVSAFLLTTTGKALSNEHFIFYNQLESPCGSVVHSGDNRTGAGQKTGKSSIFDDESVFVDLTLLPSAIARIPFCVSIHDAESRQQNFGMVRKAYIRIVDAETKRELTRYDLSEEACSETVMIFGELYRNSNGWEFRPVGQSYKGNFPALVQSFGVEVAS